MAASIARAVARIKADVRSALPDESIGLACGRAGEQAGHAWRERGCWGRSRPYICSCYG